MPLSLPPLLRTRGIPNTEATELELKQKLRQQKQRLAARHQQMKECVSSTSEPSSPTRVLVVTPGNARRSPTPSTQFVAPQEDFGPLRSIRSQLAQLNVDRVEDDDEAALLKAKLQATEVRLAQFAARNPSTDKKSISSHGAKEVKQVSAKIEQPERQAEQKEASDLKRKYIRLRQLFTPEVVNDVKRQLAYARLQRQTEERAAAEQRLVQYKKDQIMEVQNALRDAERGLEADFSEATIELGHIMAMHQDGVQAWELEQWVIQEKHRRRVERLHELEQPREKLTPRAIVEEESLSRQAKIHQMRIRRAIEETRSEHAAVALWKGTRQHAESVASLKIPVAPGLERLAQLGLAEMLSTPFRKHRFTGLRYVTYIAQSEPGPPVTGKLWYLSKIFRALEKEASSKQSKLHYLGLLKRAAANSHALDKEKLPHSPALACLAAVARNSVPAHKHVKMRGLGWLTTVAQRSKGPVAMRWYRTAPSTAFGDLVESNTRFQEDAQRFSGLVSISRVYTAARPAVTPVPTSLAGFTALIRQSEKTPHYTSWKGTPQLAFVIQPPKAPPFSVNKYPALHKVFRLSASISHHKLKWSGLVVLQPIAQPERLATDPVVVRNYPALTKLINANRAWRNTTEESHGLALIRRVADSEMPDYTLRAAESKWSIGGKTGITRAAVFDIIRRECTGPHIRDTEPDVGGHTAKPRPAWVANKLAVFNETEILALPSQIINTHGNFSATPLSVTSLTPAPDLVRRIADPREEGRVELRRYASRLGVNIDKEPHLLPLLQEGLRAALPPGWRTWISHTGAVRYANMSTGEVSLEHPSDAHYRHLVRRERLLAEQLLCSAEPSINESKITETNMTADL
eukprot:TRINITY_DN3531_c0_g1_i1.p1 TRINITY_DN3531_c0_g1~~TRINITY_DN3531_c0_g1_i1.p1  ORF type:complete len:904 (+),score=109.55 TRINITY_DN3531_c0_g1_i1:138-2714(+)